MKFILCQFREAASFFRRKLLFIALACFIAFIILSIAVCFLLLQVPSVLNELQMQLLSIFQSSGILGENGISLGLLMLNNIRAGLITALLGFVPFLFLPVFSLIVNAALIGLVGAISIHIGLSPVVFLAGILPHGIFEIPALMLSIACGVRICLVLIRKIVGAAAPGECKATFLGSLRVFILFTVPLFIIAAPIETYITPKVMTWFM